MTPPIISVIVPCYNQEAYIADALLSVKAQTFVGWECIVVDDGSTDKSKEIIERTIEGDTRFSYLYKTNGGIATARNHGITQAKGQYILPLDGDDKLHSEYIQKALAIFKQTPETKLVYCDPILFGTKNDVIHSREYSFLKQLFDNTIPCTGIFKLEDFKLTEGYNPNMKYGLEDWDFWITLLNEKDKVVKLKENLVYYRIKESSRSTLLKEQEEKNELMLLQLFKNNETKYLQYLNPIRNRIQAYYYIEESKRLKESKEYRLGKILFFPINLCIKIWRRIAR